MATRLSKIRVDEVSSVDKGANAEAQIVIMKFDRDAALAALRESIDSIFDDDAVEDKAKLISQQIADYRAHVAKRDGGDEETVMDRGQDNLIAFAKATVATGISAGLTKASLVVGITKRAAEIRQNGETDANAFTRAMTADEIGMLLRKAMKYATGPEVEPTEPEPPKAPELGPAGKKMQVLADDHLKANPQLLTQRDGGKAAAFAHVYTARENADLRRQCVNEHMGKSASAFA